MSPPLSSNASDDVRHDHCFAEPYGPDQIMHAVQLMMRDATEREDYYECTDTVLAGMKIARRMRRIESTGRIRDFTMRAFRRNGAKTEYEKVRSGQSTCTHYSYGWASNGQILELVLIDMAIFKERYLLNPAGEKNNEDGTTGFVFWPIDSIPEAIIGRETNAYKYDVSGKCTDAGEQCEWVDLAERDSRGWIKTICKKCGGFKGYRPLPRKTQRPDFLEG